MNGTADTSSETKNDKKSDIRTNCLPLGWIKLNVGGKVSKIYMNLF